MGYRDRIVAPGPKKLLALDGGGVRGVISLEILGAIEHTLRRELGRGEDFVLADYFDYIAGTSTGAIIAAGLSRGMTVDALRTLYATRGREMFDRAFIVTRYWNHRYDSDRLRELLQETLGPDVALGDDDAFRTLLMMVLRNATTDSPWPLSNNPGARYNAASRPDNNLKLPLWQLVRASTAAPTFFPPEQISIGTHGFVFVDGGLTMYNNPAFQLFLMATLGAYGLGWQTGEDRMLVVSVGTGFAPKADDRLRPSEMNLLYNATSVPAALMAAALHEQDLLCRVFGRCRHGAPIDREVGDLIDPRAGGALMPERLFGYVRYNAELTRSGLDELGLPDLAPEAVQRLDSVDHIGDLQRVGMRAARAVDREHFAGFLPVVRSAH